jgi:hypothetical protein
MVKVVCEAAFFQGPDGEPGVVCAVFGEKDLYVAVFHVF